MDHFLFDIEILFLIMGPLGYIFYTLLFRNLLVLSALLFTCLWWCWGNLGVMGLIVCLLFDIGYSRLDMWLARLHSYILVCIYLKIELHHFLLVVQYHICNLVYLTSSTFQLWYVHLLHILMFWNLSKVKHFNWSHECKEIIYERI